MLRKLAALSILAIAGSLAFSTTAKAQTVDVPFTGTLAPQCTFGTATPGTLTFTNSQSFTSGTAGSVSVTCNTANSSLRVSNVAYGSGTTNTGYTFNASAATNPGTASYTNGTAGTPVTIGVGTLTTSVTMNGSNSGIITAGSYTFNVTLEAAPN